MEKNILIIGANFTNKGAEAMLNTVVYKIARRFPTSNIYMWCKFYEEDLAKELDITPIFIPKRINSLFSFFIAIYRKLYSIVLKKDAPYIDLHSIRQTTKKISDLAAIIDISGYVYGDGWGTVMSSKVLKLKKKYPGAKVVMLPQAWGPFELNSTQKAVRNMLKITDLFYSRDKFSTHALAKLTGQRLVDILEGNDIVFGFNELTNDINQKASDYFNNDLPIIGISPNMRIYERTAGVEESNAYINMLSEVIDELINIRQFNVLLVPNEIKPVDKGYPDDRYLCNMLCQIVSNPEKCSQVKGYKSCHEIRSIVGGLNMLIGSRFHALIFALSQNVPCIALSWSHKYKELFSVFGMEDLVMEKEQFSDNIYVMKLINKVLENSESYKKQLVDTAKLLDKESDKVFDRVEVLLNE